MEHKYKRISLKIYIGIAIVTVLLNALAWGSTSFCDAYIAYVLPIWVNTYGRLTGLLPFSVGEWLIVAGALLVLAAAVLGVLSLIRRRLYRGFFVFFAWTALVVCLIMTLNCFIFYHASTFSERYFGAVSEEYSLEELLGLRNFVASQCNRLSAEVDRDGQGRVRYSGSTSQTIASQTITSQEEGSGGEVSGTESLEKRIDMEDKAREVMRQLGQTYAQLDGYYPRPKALLSSDFMCQQYMLGWYFPFSLEANYNKVAYVMNLPACMCHELAHLKGYIYEDEANFIGYLACVRSDDVYFQYSGYLSVIGYLERDLRKAKDKAPEAFAAACEKEELLELLDIVYEDDVFVTDEEWERINKKALFDTETVSEATDAFLDTTLKANGVADGKISYSRVVRLLLQYYREVLIPG